MNNEELRKEVRKTRNAILNNLDDGLNVIDEKLDIELSAKLDNLLKEMKSKNCNRLDNFYLRIYA